MIKPLNYRVIVKQHKIEDVDPAFEAAKKAGFVFAGTEHSRESQAVDMGIVVGVGETAELVKDLAVGHEVFFARHAGKKIKDPVDKEEYLILNDEDILAVVIGD